METIQFSDELRIGIEDLDSHHQHLFRLFNSFCYSFAEVGRRERIGLLLDEMIDYATYHFSLEEGWMEANSFPDLCEHRLQHGKFTARVVEIQRDFTDGKNNLSLEIMSFLKNWLISHITGLDRDIGLFEKRGRIRGA